MKIVANTDERLVVEHRPVLSALAVWTAAAGTAAATVAQPEAGTAVRALLLALALGLAAIAWWFLPMQRYSFDRARGEVERSTWRAFRPRTDSLPLARIRRARQQADWNDGARVTRLALELDDQVVPLSHAYGGGDLDTVEAAINAWLGRP